jgi:uncharacterized membrane protein YphA (DoxX/SURF4 family)
LYEIPGISNLLDFVFQAEVWMIERFNAHVLQVKDTLNQNGGGSGDTSFAWAQFHTWLIVSLLGCVIWTLIDRKRQNSYHTLDFWLINIVRYYIALVAFTYGIIKLFALQMPFPNLSQLATPLGDYLPMRLSWMFIGYSTQYQIFSGVMETIVGMLLLNRRTVTLGALLGIGVFTNVFILNISYDIPVKLYSMQLLICCLFLAVRDWRRLSDFFLLNKEAKPTRLYDFDLTKKWQRIARIVFKVGFVIYFVAMPFNQSWSRYKEEANKGELKPIKVGVYTVKTVTKNNDTLPLSNDDEMIWKDFIFDRGGMGSVNTLDTLFFTRYRRGYFTYQPDSLTETISFKKYATDTTNLFEMKYKIIDDTTLELWGKIKTDSLRFSLQRSNRHFQLAEKQFHWISESNR